VLIAIIIVVQIFIALLFEFTAESKRLTKICLASAPFLLIRLIHQILVIFDNHGRFNERSLDILTLRVMQYLPEFIIITPYTIAGNLLENRADEEKAT
jgi:hypothetical protein